MLQQESILSSCKMARIQCCAVAVSFFCLVILSRLSFIASKSLRFSIKLIPRDSPESPLYPGNLTQFERNERMVDFSRAKAQHIMLRSTANTTFDDEKYLTRLWRQVYYYTGEIQIGTPPQTVHLVIDSGAALIWTQCQPCINCFHQVDPIYDPRASFTYQRVPCQHPLCTHQDPSSSFQCVDGECVYANFYGGGAVGPSRGYFSRESFHFLTDRDNNTEAFNILFGCSNNNTNFDTFGFPDNMITGILGLNLSPESLLNQLYYVIGGTFSYCIPRLDQPFAPNHVLRFGNDVFMPEGYIPATPYFTFESLYYYYLLCADISVGVYRLGLPPGTFDAGDYGGLILDSGAPVTVLSTHAMNGVNVYQLVIGILANYYAFFQFVRIPQDENPTPYELCYWERQGFTSFPSLTYHLMGADFTVDGRYMNMKYPDEGYFCVGIIGSPGISILGTNHMQNKRIIHNGNMNLIQFYDVNCDQDRFL